jgi:hypothetical protein
MARNGSTIIFVNLAVRKEFFLHSISISTTTIRPSLHGAKYGLALVKAIYEKKKTREPANSR